jgi:hypothetical protein
MIEGMQLRNLAPETREACLHCIAGSARLYQPARKTSAWRKFANTNST